MPTGIYKRTEYHREINRKGHLGQKSAMKDKKYSLEYCKKLSSIHKKLRHKPPIFNKSHTKESREKIRQTILAKRDAKKCLVCLKIFRVPRSSSKKYCSRNCYYEICKGRYLAEKSPLWQGGITPINMKIRNSKEYKDWRIRVFRRDDYTCQECGSRGMTLHADHIKPFAYYPELRLVIENGRTLCVPCHKKTDTFAGRAKSDFLQAK